MRQFGLFVVAGGLAALANIGSRVVYSQVLPLVAAVVLAYATGMVVAFVLNRRFVFGQARDATGRRVLRFAMVNVLALAQTLAVTLLGTWALGGMGVAVAPAETLAHGAGVAVPVLTSYLLHRRWTFGRIDGTR